MRSRGIIVTLVVILVLLFTVLNWPSLAVELPLNLIFFQLQAPLGLLLIGFTLTLSFVFLLLSLLRRAGQLRQLAHLEAELERERALVEKKRLGEFERLEGHLSERFSTLENNLQQTLTEQYSRLEAGERTQVERLEAQVLSIRNELSSELSELETSLRRGLPPARDPDS